MYARYIPPPKSKPQPPFLADQSVSADVQTETRNDSGFSLIPNARYVTPSSQSAAVPKKIVFGDDDDFPVPEPKKRKLEEDETHGNSAKKASKSKTAKQPAESSSQRVASPHTDHDGPPQPEARREKRSREKSQEHEILEPELEPEPALAQGDPDAMDIDDAPAARVTPIEKPPKKPKKKESKRKSEASALESEKYADVDPRYKAILEKKDKAIKSTKPKKVAEGEIEESDGHENQGEEAEQPDLHGLEPFPQPERVATHDPILNYETMPGWLASPIQVSSTKRAPFSDLGIAPEAAKILESQGINDAFAVQTAAIPLLLPQATRQGDLVISAATGSGKTLAYVLPMVRDISLGSICALRGIIVLPTRDLVDQVRKTCEACSIAFASGGGRRVVIGEALGKNEFKKEQAKIMEMRRRYDPDGYRKHLQARASMVQLDDNADEENITYSLNHVTRPLPDHVIEHVPAVDILICTPGRLVEHIRNTPGFTLDYVRWLIVDEADKLLAQDFQDWLAIVVDKLGVNRPGARDFPGSNKSGVRKVILSATMTRDLSLLNSLKLSRPKLIVLDVELKLPDLLKESAIRIRNPELKPLYLLDLLGKISNDASTSSTDSKRPSGDQAEDSDSSDSDSDSDSESSVSDSSDSSGSSSSTSSAAGKPVSHMRHAFNTTALIFTRSTEAAIRLTRLLGILSPNLAPLIGTLASATRSIQRERTLRAFAQGKTRILIASDLVSRGIDLPNLDHVINYDIPSNATSYVHRVGRTARAGKAGQAWTLLAHAEAYAFWNELGGEGKGKGSNAISRARKVERARIWNDKEEFPQQKVDAYEKALARLGQEVGEGRKQHRNMESASKP